MKPPLSPRGAAFSLAGSMLLVGAYVSAAPLLLAWFPLAVLASLRFLLAGLLMLPWLRRPAGAPPLRPWEHGLLFVQALFGNVLFTVLMLEGVARGGALLAGSVMAALPAAVALLAWALLGEKPGPRVGGAVALGGAGIALLAWLRHAGPGAATEPWGLPLLLGALACEALQAVLGKHLSGRHAPRFITAGINLWCLVLCLPMGLAALPAWPAAAVPAGAWAGLLAYALMASVLAVWLWMRGLSVLPASTAGLFTVLLPLSAAAVGLLVGGERAGPGHALAYALALGGLLLGVMPARRQGGRGA